MDVKLDYSITVDEFLEMVESVGWKTYTIEQIEKALQNTMYMVKATVNGKLAGIGRVVGDYSIVCILTDICVKPEFQDQGIGLKITSELKKLISAMAAASARRHHPLHSWLLLVLEGMKLFVVMVHPTCARISRLLLLQKKRKLLERGRER